MRDRYAKEKRCITAATMRGSSAVSSKLWKYMQLMKFLHVHISH